MVTVLPWGMNRRPNRPNVRIGQKSLETFRRENGIVVMKKILRLMAERGGFPDLLAYPRGSRVGRHVDVLYPSPRVADNDKNV